MHMFTVLLDSATNDAASVRMSQESLVPTTSFPTQHLSPPNKPSATTTSLEPEYQWLGGEDFNLSSFLDTSKDATNSSSHFLSSSKDTTTNFLEGSKDGGNVSTNFLDSTKDSMTAVAGFLDSSKEGRTGITNFLESPKVEGNSMSNFLESPKVEGNSMSNFLDAKETIVAPSFLESPKAGTCRVFSVATPGKKTSASGNGFTGSGQQVLGILGENSRDSLGGKFDVSMMIIIQYFLESHQ